MKTRTARIAGLVVTVAAALAMCVPFGGGIASAQPVNADIALPVNHWMLPYLDSTKVRIDFDRAGHRLQVSVTHRGVRPPQEIGWRFYNEGLDLSKSRYGGGEGIYLGYSRQPLGGVIKSALLTPAGGDQVSVPVTVTESGPVTTYLVTAPQLSRVTLNYVAGWTSDGTLGLPRTITDKMPTTRI